MFVIMTDFVVHFYVENLLKVLKVLKTNIRACARARLRARAHVRTVTRDSPLEGAHAIGGDLMSSPLFTD